MFGEQVRAYRQRLGLTQKELADRTGMSVRSIGELEACRRRPRPTTVRLLADAFGLTGADRAHFCQAASGGGTDSGEPGEVSATLLRRLLARIASSTRRLGTLYYLETVDRAAKTLRLVSWTPGQTRPMARFALPVDAADNANVSPDGRWVSWVDRGGALRLADLTGRSPERLLRPLVDGRLVEPTWCHDSRRLLVNDLSGAGDGVVGTVQISSSAFTPLPHKLSGVRHPVYAPEGDTLAFVRADGAVMVAQSDGSGSARVPTQRLAAQGWHVAGVQSLSAGGKPAWGRWLTLFVTRPGRERDARSLVSNVTLNSLDGREVGMIGGVGSFTAFQAWYQPSPGFGNAAHVLRRLTNPRRVDWIGSNGEYWDGDIEPAELQHFRLLNTRAVDLRS